MIRATIATLGLLTFTSGCGDNPPRDTISYSFFIEQIENRDDVTKETGNANVLFVEIGDHEILGIFLEPPAAPSGGFDSGGNELPPSKEYLSKYFRVNVTPSVQANAELTKLLKARGVRFEIK